MNLNDDPCATTSGAFRTQPNRHHIVNLADLLIEREIGLLVTQGLVRPMLDLDGDPIRDDDGDIIWVTTSLGDAEGW